MKNIPKTENAATTKPEKPITKKAGKKWYKRLGRIVLRIFVWFLVLSNVWVILYRWLPVPFTPLMAIRLWEQYTDDKKLKCEYSWQAWDDISKEMPRAVIISEDQKFLTHYGFDLKAISKAMKRNSKGRRRVVGGSTISQQTAKNAFLFPSRTYLRKGLEAYFTLLIEIWWPKSRIMQVYLNVIEMGDGIYGCEAASKAYFHHNAILLKASEAASIAAVLPNPRKYKVNKPGPYVKYRQQVIQRRMGKLPAIIWD